MDGNAVGRRASLRRGSALGSSGRALLGGATTPAAPSVPVGAGTPDGGRLSMTRKRAASASLRRRSSAAGVHGSRSPTSHATEAKEETAKTETGEKMKTKAEATAKIPLPPHLQANGGRGGRSSPETGAVVGCAKDDAGDTDGGGGGGARGGGGAGRARGAGGGDADATAGGGGDGGDGAKTVDAGDVNWGSGEFFLRGMIQLCEEKRVAERNFHTREMPTLVDDCVVC